MTKAKLAFVHCRLGCLSCRPVCFFPRLFPFACPLLFACRRFRCPALGPAGFSPRRIFRQRLIVFSFPPSGLLFSPSFPFCRYFPSLFVFSFVAFCIWSFFSAFLFSFLSVLFFLFYREATSGRKTGGHGRRMALKLFLPMARQKETPPKRGNFYK